MKYLCAISNNHVAYLFQAFDEFRKIRDLQESVVEPD